MKVLRDAGHKLIYLRCEPAELFRRIQMDPSTGVLSGTPTVAGHYEAFIAGTDTLGALGYQDYAIAINPPPALAPPALSDWTLGQIGRTDHVSASGGTGVLVLALPSGALPDGLSLDAGSSDTPGLLTDDAALILIERYDLWRDSTDVHLLLRH